MTIGEFLKDLNIMNRSVPAKFSDGTMLEDNFNLTIYTSGHGKFLDAEIDDISIARFGVFLSATGESELRGKEKPPVGEDRRRTDGLEDRLV